jgi:hypothetical protein
MDIADAPAWESVEHKVKAIDTVRKRIRQEKGLIDTSGVGKADAEDTTQRTSAEHQRTGTGGEQQVTGCRANVSDSIINLKLDRGAATALVADCKLKSNDTKGDWRRTRRGRRVLIDVIGLITSDEIEDLVSERPGVRQRTGIAREVGIVVE